MSRVEQYLSEVAERRAKKRGVRRFAWFALGISGTILLLTSVLGDRSGLGMALLAAGFWISAFVGVAALVWGVLSRNRLSVVVGCFAIVATWWNWNRPVLFSSPQQPKTPTLSILSYNIAENEPEGGKGQLMLGLIESARADVMIFQEASIIANDPVFRKCLRGYNTALTQQVAIATKVDVCEVVQIQEVDFEPQEKPAVAEGNPGRFGIIATVKWREKLLHIVGFQMRPRFAKGDPSGIMPLGHYQMVADYRAKQLEKVRKRVAKLKGPILFAVDLDVPPIGPTYGFFASSFGDAWIAAGKGVGATFQNERTQYVFFSNHWRTSSVALPWSDASTHRPVLAKLELMKDETRLVKLIPDPNGDGVIEDPDTFEKIASTSGGSTGGSAGSSSGTTSTTGGSTGTSAKPNRTRWAPLGTP